MKGKVMVFLNSLALGGAEKFVSIWAPKMVKRGWEVKVVYLHPPRTLLPALSKKGIEALQICRVRGELLGPLRRLLELVKRENPDILQTHLPRSGALARIAGRLSGTTVVSTIQTTPDLFNAKEKMAMGTILLADGVVFISEAVKRTFWKSAPLRYVMARKPTRVIPNAVDVEEIEASKPKDVAKARIEEGCSPEELVILNVGSFKPQKGQEFLLKAMVKVAKECPDARLLLVGDGPLRPQMERLSRELGLENIVSFLGTREDVPRLLWICDIFAFPSVGEGLGVAAIEAMAAGKPVVGTKVGGIPEVVRDGIDGLLVPPRDPDSLARAILSLALDKKKREAMGRHGKERALLFSADSIAQKYEDFYLELLNRRRRMFPHRGERGIN